MPRLANSTRFFPVMSLFLLTLGSVGESVASDQGDDVYKQVVRSVVAIAPRIDGAEPTIGTGWILDAKRNLILTNQHVIEGSSECSVYLPVFNGEELDSSKETTLVPHRALLGEVVDSSRELDLAIVRVRDLPSNLPMLKVARKNGEPGQRIHSIAGSAEGTQGLWTYSTGHVRQRVLGQLANNGSAMVLESDMATNCGNSGGPVFNDQGEVVAVVEGHRTDARLVSIYVDRESILKYLSEAKPTIAPTTIEDLALTAERHIDEGRPETAIRYCTLAINQQATPRLLNQRAAAWLETGDEELAEGDLRQALELDPKFAPALSTFGILRDLQGNAEDALNYFSEAIRSEPNSPVYRFNRAMCRYSQDQFEGCLHDLTKIEASPERANAIKSLTAKCEYQLGKFDEASTKMAKLIQQDQADAEVMHMMGRMAAHHEMLEEAEIYYTAAISISGDEIVTEYYYDALELLFATKQLDKAFNLADKITDLAPDYDYGWFAYGVCVFEANPQEGIDAVELAIELDSEVPAYHEVLEIFQARLLEAATN